MVVLLKYNWSQELGQQVVFKHSSDQVQKGGSGVNANALQHVLLNETHSGSGSVQRHVGRAITLVVNCSSSRIKPDPLPRANAPQPWPQRLAVWTRIQRRRQAVGRRRPLGRKAPLVHRLWSEKIAIIRRSGFAAKPVRFRQMRFA